MRLRPRVPMGMISRKPPAQCIDDTIHIADPAITYGAYRSAIERRDLAAVLALLTPESGQQLRLWSRAPDFNLFFDLWCGSQCGAIEIVRHVVDAERAVVEARVDDGILHVDLRWVGDRWLVESDEYMASRASAGKA